MRSGEPTANLQMRMTMLLLAGMDLICRPGCSLAAASLVLGLQMCTIFTKRCLCARPCVESTLCTASDGELSHDSLRQATTLFPSQAGKLGHRQVNLPDATQLMRLTRICYHLLVTQGLQILRTG